MLKDADPAVASSAAAALGRMGGPEAIQALLSAIPAQNEFTPPAVLDGLLNAANRAMVEGKGSAAGEIFERLYRMPAPGQVRAGAYRGLIAVASPERALELVKQGLLGEDGPSRQAALEMARFLTGPGDTAMLCDLFSRPALPLQAALIETLHQRGDTTAVPALSLMARNPDPALRIPAIRALGDLGDDQTVRLLLDKAGTGSDAEKQTARQALLNLHRGRVSAALVSQIAAGQPSAQMEAARALAGRGDRTAAADLLALARQHDGSTHRAACQALGRLADASHFQPLVRLIVDAKNETSRIEARDALQAVCQRLQSQGIPTDAGPIVAGLSNSDSRVQGALLMAAGGIIDDRIREAVRGASRSSDPNMRQAAVSTLEQTHDRELLPDILKLARETKDPSDRIQLLRIYLRLAMDPAAVPLTGGQCLRSLQPALPLLSRPDEKWLILAGLSKFPTPETLRFALSLLEDPATQSEAAQASMQIAAGLMNEHDMLARAALEKVLAVTDDDGQRKQAEALLKQLPGTRKPDAPVTFLRQKLDGAFRSEGVAVADFNRDGALDIATGNILYLGPEWKPQPMLTEPKAYPPEEYSQEFLCFDSDIDLDGWLDLIVAGFPGAQTRWLRNPGAAGGPWQEFPAIEKTGNESPDWVDVDRDGRKELVFMSENGMALARPGKDPRAPWPIRVIAGPNDPKPGHGLGIGDINGDGRPDVLCPQGWWEGPTDRDRLPWTFHAARLGFDTPAQMPVLDVNGDGLNDVISSGAHRYGLWWYEQTADGWLPYEIDCSISQLHAAHAADLNRDGLPDLVTGKRFWAHRHDDEGIDDPAVLVWYELTRQDRKPVWIRHDIDADSGVGLHFAIVDINADGLLDIVTSSKKGVYLFLQEKEP